MHGECNLFPNSPIRPLIIESAPGPTPGFNFMEHCNASHTGIHFKRFESV